MYINATVFLAVSVPVLIQYPCDPLRLSEPLVYRCPGSLRLGLWGDLFWVSRGPEAGHGGNCFRDPTPPLSNSPAVTLFTSEVLKKTLQKGYPKVRKISRRLSN